VICEIREHFFDQIRKSESDLTQRKLEVLFEKMTHAKGIIDEEGHAPDVYTPTLLSFRTETPEEVT